MANYMAYYQLYNHWHSNTFGSSDSAALFTLANMCPVKDGAVVYQARTLLRIITHQYPLYNDDYCAGSDSGPGTEGGLGGGGEQRRAPVRAAIQSYGLLPNPNDGNIQLWQTVGDKAPVSIVVYNTIGAVVYKTSAIFESNATCVHLSSMAPGLYYMILHDSRGVSYNLKFVKK